MKKIMKCITMAVALLATLITVTLVTKKATGTASLAVDPFDSGLEQSFFSVTCYDKPDIRHHETVTGVEDDALYRVQFYVQNRGTETAIGTRVRLNVPEPTEGSATLQGYMSADNDSAGELFAQIEFQAEHKFHLVPVYGDEYLCISDGITKFPVVNDNGDLCMSTVESESGQLVSSDGSFEGYVEPGEDGWIIFATLVRVVYDYDLNIKFQGHIKGDTEWDSNIETEDGDIVEVELSYVNDTDEIHPDFRCSISISADNQPENVIVTTGKHPEGMEFDIATLEAHRGASYEQYPEGLEFNIAMQKTMIPTHSIELEFGDQLPGDMITVRYCFKAKIPENLFTAANTFCMIGTGYWEHHVAFYSHGYAEKLEDYAKR